ncbi:MAG: hypothetical protein HY240_09755 [Actinobacteria bacterium]|nr:hypothetical protein [Actinomycetota bacterium]
MAAIGAVSVLSLVVGGGAHAWLDWIIDIAAPTAMAVGIRRNRPSRPGLWWALTAGLVLFAAGDMINDFSLHFQPGLRSPSPSNVFYLGGYAAIVTGLWGLGARRGSGTDAGRGWLDGLIVGSAAGFFVWFFVIDRYEATVFTSLSSSVIVAYPVLALASVPALARLFFAPGKPTTSFRLLEAGSVLLLASSIGYAVTVANGDSFVESWIGAGWMLSCGVFAAAALHPSAARAFDRSSDQGNGLTRLRAYALTTIVLSPFATAVLTHIVGGRVQWGLFAVGSGLLVAMVMLRMVGLVGQEAELREGRARQDERLRLMHRMTRLAENERSKIAAEIHDGAVQHLSSVGLQTERAILRVGRGETAEAEAILRTVSDRLSEEVRELRRVMAGLRPPVLEQMGLEAAIKDLADPAASAAGFELTLDLQLASRPDPDTEIALYRVAQEGIANVAKHAGARHVRVAVAGS